MASEASKQPKSQPLQVFEDHLEYLKRLLDVRRSFTTANLKIIVDDLRGLATMQQPDALGPAVAAVQLKLDDVLNVLTTTFAFLDAWQLVMLVSFTEAYLEDALILLVQKNPDWMQESTQNVSYAELLRATSIPDLLTEMQRRWAKNIIELSLRQALSVILFGRATAPMQLHFAAQTPSSFQPSRLCGDGEGIAKGRFNTHKSNCPAKLK